MSQRPFASTATCRKTVITTRILQLVQELCIKRIHVTKRDLFYTDVKLFEVRDCAVGMGCNLRGGEMEGGHPHYTCARLEHPTHQHKNMHRARIGAGLTWICAAGV